ncbi:MAG: hypothetical protein AB7T48_12825, partial [Solirubrobacterales bacterium]
MASALSALCLASPASAAFGLSEFDVSFSGPKGEVALKAGSHPFAMTTGLAVNTETTPAGTFPVEAVKDLEILQVPGFAGNPTAVPPCSTLDFFTGVVNFPELPECADASAVGVVKLTIGDGIGKPTLTTPLYNLAPPPGAVAKLGFRVYPGVPVTIDLKVSPFPPYNVLASVTNISQALEFFDSELKIWGVPADPVHDAERGVCLIKGGSCSAGVVPRPFLTLPRACTGPLATNYELDSWLNPGVWVKGSALTHDDAEPPNARGLNGCGELDFSPRVEARPSSTSAESSAGLDVEVEVNDEGLDNPEGTANSDIKRVVMSLPKGVTLNPSAAEGLGVCTKAQFEAEAPGTPPNGGCPESSTLGSFEAETPILENKVVRGFLYLAQQDDPATTTPAAENPFDSLVALYLVIRDPALGIFVKQAGKVETDEATGQIRTSFDEIPQFPLSRISLHLRSGPRAPLVTPPTCGSYASTTTLTPWSGSAPLQTTSSFSISSGPGGGPCPAGGVPPFDPGFEAGSLNNAAAHYSPFYMRLTRGDGEQDLTRFDAVLPPGVTGKIAGVPRCSDAAIEAAKARTGRQELAAPSCPAASQIGHVIAGAGVGTALTYVPGQIYLAGPYGGHPLSIAAIVPAVAGPFDAGTVVTRVALDLNPTTGEVEVDGAASDPIPHILKGIPLKVRDLQIFVDRPNFTLNPTSCDPTAARASIFGSGADPFSPADDLGLPRSARYQAADCQSLPFKPKLTLALEGATKRAQHPKLTSVLTPRPGDANIGRAVVT